MSETSIEQSAGGFRPVRGLEAFDDAAIEHLYGRWQPLAPHEVMELLGEAPFPWWIAGGWALDAAGRKRKHWDMDVVVLRRDLQAVQEWLSDFHLWEVQEGNLRPFLPEDELAPDREQLWVRRDADSPWVLDLLLTPADGDWWLYKRDRSLRRSLDEIGHRVGDIPYLKPSLVLLFKAKAHRSKDDADFDWLFPHLPESERRWLADALAREKPDHPWLRKLTT